MTADRNLRRAVSELMVDVHLIPRQLAEYHVATMDDFEIARRFQMYTGMELSAAERNLKSDPDFYQVFGLATATARTAALNPVPGFRPIRTTGGSLPELETKNLVR